MKVTFNVGEQHYTGDVVFTKPHEIIDFALKGNVIRFYLGKNGEQWGDDWDDYPYECNAGEVYDEYITGTVDSYVPFDCFVLEPSNGCRQGDSGFSKQDMIKGKTPCIIIVPASQAKGSYYDKDFKYWVGCKDAIKIYFGDDITKIQEQIDDLYIDAAKGVDES